MSQVSRILLSILADLNNSVVWMVSARLLISKSSSPCTHPLVTIPSVSPSLSFSTVFFDSLESSRYFFFSLSFNFTQWLAGTAKSTIQQVLFFFSFFFFFCWFGEIYPRHHKGLRAKKPRGNNIICRLLQDLWLHTQREDGANTTRQRPTQRSRRSHNDAI